MPKELPDGNPELRSINPDHPPIPATKLEGWRVRAVVVGIIHARTGQPGPNLEYDDGSPIMA